MYLLGFDIGGTKCAYVLAEWDGNEIKLLEYVRDKNCVDLQLLPIADELRAIYEADPLIPCLDSILLGYQKKIDLIESHLFIH